MRITKSVRNDVLAKNDGRCYYCGIPLSDRWHVDHFKPVLRGCGAPDSTGKRGLLHEDRETFENLVPSCVGCNLFKSTYDVEFWRSEIEQQIYRLRKSSAGFKALERFGLITIHGGSVTFDFERRAATTTDNGK